MAGASLRRKAGFTLVELLVTVALVGLIASVSFPLMELSSRRAREQDLRDALRQIRTAIDRYKQAGQEGRIAVDAKESGYPHSLNELVAGVPDIKSPDKSQKIYFLRRLPADPMAVNATIPAERTWALRSYASPADSPQPGADVFDVHSMSARVGLNGVPYNKW